MSCGHDLPILLDFSVHSLLSVFLCDALSTFFSCVLRKANPGETQQLLTEFFTFLCCCFFFSSGKVTNKKVRSSNSENANKNCPSWKFSSRIKMSDQGKTDFRTPCQKLLPQSFFKRCPGSSLVLNQPSRDCAMRCLESLCRSSRSLVDH